jgi:PAS domain-containing protein
MTFGSDGRIRYLNHWAQHYLGLSGDGRVATWRQVVASDDVQTVECALQELDEGLPENDVDARLLRQDGELRWHTLHIQYPNGYATRRGATTLSVVAVDVHQCKLARRLYEESESRLFSAFEAADIGACEWDVEAGTARVTPVVCRLYGIDPVQTVPLQLLWDKVRPDQRVGGDNDYVRSCCLTKECYPTDCCRFALFSSFVICRARSGRPPATFNFSATYTSAGASRTFVGLQESVLLRALLATP